MTDFISLLFVAMIPIDCKITNFPCISIIVKPWLRVYISVKSQAAMVSTNIYHFNAVCFYL